MPISGCGRNRKKRSWPAAFIGTERTTRNIMQPFGSIELEHKLRLFYSAVRAREEA